MREPEIPGVVGRSLKGTSAFSRMNGPNGGTFESVATLDGRTRLYAFQWVGALPLVQAVAASTEVHHAA